MLRNPHYRRPSPRRVTLLAGIVVGAQLLAGCTATSPAPQTIDVVAQVDASGSSQDLDFYYRQFAQALTERQGLAMVVSVIAIGGTADPAEVCQPVGPVTVAPDPNAEDPQAAWKAGARQLLAAAKPLFDCAQAADVDGSAITGFVHARGADQLWLFTDALFNDVDLAVDPDRLDDSDYVAGKVAKLPTGDNLDGVEVAIYGAGVNSGLSNSAMAGLTQVLNDAVESQGGRVTEMRTY